jgi:HSP20 family molecular chaperone IbpA
MFSTVFGEFPVNHYTYRDYSKAIDALANDVLNFTSLENTSSYSLKEIEDSIVFDCIAPSITKENLSITFKDRKLSVKSVGETKDLAYFKPINISLPLRKDIDVTTSFAELENGVLKITMPLKEDLKENKISFK